MSILRTLRERAEPLDVNDVAELLNVTDATVQRWVRRRQIPAIRIGDVIRFDAGALADWMAKQGRASQRRQNTIEDGSAAEGSNS